MSKTGILISQRATFVIVTMAILILLIYGHALANVPVCIFMDESDYSVVWGKPKLVANTLTEEHGLRGPAGMQTIGVFPCQSGYEVFTCNSKEQPPVLYRYLTSNFVEYSEPQMVLKLPDDHQWLGFRSLIKRPDKSEYLLMAAEKVIHDKEGHYNGIYYFRSYDGLEWEQLNNGRAAYHDHDMGGLIWNPATEQYVVWQITYQPYRDPFNEYTDNISQKRRVISVRTSIDGTNWNPSVDLGKKMPFRPDQELFYPDKDDSPDLQFYGAQIFPYANRFLAAVQVYAPSPQIANPNQNAAWTQRNTTSPKHGPQGFVEWWVVRDPADSSTWNRPFRQLDVVEDTDLNRLRHAPVILNDKHIEFNSRTAFSIPLYRITGLKSKLNSIVDTNLFSVPLTALSLNASAAWHPNKHQDFQRQAYIMAEVHNAAGEIISGYEKDKCIIKDIDSLNIPLKWGQLTTANLSGQQISLRFYFRDATLFSVQ